MPAADGHPPLCQHAPFGSDDTRDVPGLHFPEAARYLGIPTRTVRYWLVGRGSGRTDDFGTSGPLIHTPAGAENRLSFNNLVEAHVSLRSNGTTFISSPTPATKLRCHCPDGEWLGTVEVTPGSGFSM